MGKRNRRNGAKSGLDWAAIKSMADAVAAIAAAIKAIKAMLGG